MKGEPKHAAPIAILDTNVIVDLYSWHDWLDHFEPKYSYASVLVDKSDAKSRYRIRRPREALLLAIHLHQIGAVTFSLSESVRMINKLVNPDAVGDPKKAFAQTFLYFVKPTLLGNWKDGMRYSNSHGNRADDELLQEAKDSGIPLVTSEGYSHIGIDEGNRMRKKARRMGIQILTAREFCKAKVDDDDGLNFLKAFSKNCRAYIDRSVARGSKRSAVVQAIDGMHGYYRELLLPPPRPFRDLLIYR